MTRPLEGIRVLDLTTILLGPVATQMLGDLGADVIKIEAPGGDPLRAVGPPPARGRGAVFLGCNRGKRSLEIDLKDPRGHAALLRLVETADVFFHNMRPAAADRLRLDHATLAARNPRLVYCAAHGYRREGPYGDRPAYDDMIQAASGLATLQGAGGEPRYATSVIADKVTGLTAAAMVLAALVQRERTGEGQAVEVPMLETMVAFNLIEHLYGRTFEPPRGPCGYPRTLSRDRRPYATRDGWIAVLPYTDRQWRALFEVARRPDLAADPRFATLAERLAHVDELYATLAAILAGRTTAEWLAALDAAQVPASAVASPDDLIDDPHLGATGFWHLADDPELGRVRLPGFPARFSRAEAGPARLAPRLGEHGAEVLAEAGLAPEEIAALVGAGVVGSGPHGHEEEPE